MALIDGTTGEYVGGASFGERGDPLTVAQYGDGAVAADGRTGQLYRLNAATLQAERLAAQPLSGLPGVQVLTGSGTAHAVSTNGTYLDIDPNTGAVDGSVVALRHPLDSAAEAIDSGGRLWALDGGGTVVSGSAAGMTLAPNVATPGVSRLVTVGAGVAVVDPVRRTVTELRANGKAARKACLPDRVGTSIAVETGATSGRVLVASDATGSLIVANLATGNCSRSIQLASGHPSFGSPVESGDYAFVPDLKTGNVYIVSLPEGKLLFGRSVLQGRPSELQLDSVGGTVFYNDPASQRAGVIKVDGTIEVISKYGLASRTTTSNSAAPTTASTSPQSAGPTAEGLNLIVHHAVVNEQATLQITPKGNQPLLGATWTFDDTSATSTGLTVQHIWTLAGTHSILVTALTATGKIQTQRSVNVVSATSSSPTATPTLATGSTPPARRTVPPATPTPAARTTPSTVRQGRTSTAAPPPSQSTSGPTTPIVTSPRRYGITLSSGEDIDLEDGVLSRGPEAELSFAWVAPPAAQLIPDIPCQTCPPVSRSFFTLPPVSPTTTPPPAGGGVTTPTTPPSAGGGVTTPTTPPPPGGGVTTTPPSKTPIDRMYLATWTLLNGALLGPDVTATPTLAACQEAASSTYETKVSMNPALGSSWCFESGAGAVFVVSFDSPAASTTGEEPASITVEE
ncbi:hypothetical protein acdb102_22660 [Acidothermaceae bacterium B102]|nr:hypothetical protein acdb102_22660 [Acidothermaceae bacterium B102]